MSTYSPSLRIELITTGTQAGTWGNTTNTNLGTLVESAIAGYISVSIISANQALTALNGAADQSRHMTLALTTTTTANFNVYAPPAEKTYVIFNSSSYTATIFNSTVTGNTTAAGTGVAIPAGRTVTVWSDGTNFAFQNSHLGSLTLATDLAVADGGTGASAFASGGLLRGNGTSALSVASAADIVAQIGTTAVTNATNAVNATNATTQAAKTSDTTIATTAFVDRLRSMLTATTGSGGGTAVIGDRGCLLSVTAGVTVPASVFAANDTFSIYNNSAASITITQGAGLTLRQVGTANTGNRTLNLRGLATVVFISATEAVISGGGLS